MIIYIHICCCLSKKGDIHTRQISTISFPARMCLDVQGYEKFVTAVGPLGAKLHIALHYSGQCVPPDPANSTDDVGFMILRIFFASLCYNLSSMQTHRESKCTKTQLTRISHFLPFNVAKRCQRNSPDNGPRYLMTVSATFAESAHPTVEPPAPFGRRWNPDPSPGCCFWCRCW